MRASLRPLTGAVVLLAAAVVTAAILLHSTPPAAQIQLATRATSAAAASCPVTGAGNYVSCIREPDSATPNVGLEVTQGSGANPGTPIQITDHTGAPVWWVNLFGMYSGGDGGKMPGGLICVTYSVTSEAACLTPTGDLTLEATGPNGPTGPVETLTPRDIAWIHQHGG